MTLPSPRNPLSSPGSAREYYCRWVRGAGLIARRNGTSAYGASGLSGICATVESVPAAGRLGDRL
jgi:hypothetical protein